MNYNKKGRRLRALLCALAVGASLLLPGCATEEDLPAGESGVEMEQDSQLAEESAQEPSHSTGEYDSWRDADSTAITLNGSSISVEGSGATAEGGIATITAPGVYVISGALDDGQIRVEATKEDTVQLVLNGASIHCSTSAAIYSAKAGLTVLTLAEGAENHVSDGAEYQYPDGETDEPDAAVFCKDDLLIHGPGSLSVSGNFNNGIGSKDDLVIESGSLLVEAINHGIRGRDSVTILNGDFTIAAGNDGIQSNNDSGEGKGWILLEGGTFRITSEHDGIQAETSLTIRGGDFTIRAGGGNETIPEDLDGSYKGLKAGTDFSIKDGTFDLDCADDTVHANGDVTISGGTLLLASGDDGIHADAALTIDDGSITITASYEGLEGETVTVNGGEIRLIARDDGINAAGGTDSSGEGPFGPDRFRASDNNLIAIHGGLVVVTASGDGIDSNGNVVMTGGTLLVNGPTRGGDAPLDFDGSFTLSGGILVATGSSAMAQAPGEDSTQATLQVYLSSTYEAGTPVHLADSEGSPLLTFIPESDFQNLVVSTPDLVEGETYRLYTGGTESGAVSHGLALDCDYSGGDLLAEITLSAITTRVSDTGEAVSGFGGFGGGFGGGRDGGRPGDGGRPEGQDPGGDFPGEPPSGDPPGGGSGPGGELPEMPAGERPGGGRGGGPGSETAGD